MREIREEITMSTATLNRRELAHRESDGIAVTLFWSAVGDTLTLEVDDSRSCEQFELEVPKDRALDAFNHPFAYLAMGAPREDCERVAA
jgi:hypothetical protein